MILIRSFGQLVLLQFYFVWGCHYELVDVVVFKLGVAQRVVGFGELC